MSTFTAPLEIASDAGERWARIEAIVDTGSTYTWVPGGVLTRIGVRPRFKREFETADKRVVSRDIGVAMARINGEEIPTIVVFAEPGGPALLGAYTLEGFGLASDPANERLIRVRGLAMTSI